MLPFVYDKTIFPSNPTPALDRQEFFIPWERLLPSFALDISSNEGCGWTHPELHSYLIDGITVGGHTIKDEDIVRNIKTCWDVVKGISEDINSLINLQFVFTLHSVLMKGLLRNTDIGAFRKSNVQITGTSAWQCVPAEQLRDIFLQEYKDIREINNPIEQAVVAQLWLSYRQFFADGNKRVARMWTNVLLANNRVGIFTVPANAHTTFMSLLCEFYDTADASEICAFILRYCLHLFDDTGYYLPPLRYSGTDTIAKLKFE